MIVRVAGNDITRRVHGAACKGSCACALIHVHMYLTAHMFPGKKTLPLRVYSKARCKHAEHRREDAGEGSTGDASKQIKPGKGRGLWEEGEERREKRQGSSILTTCTIKKQKECSRLLGALRMKGLGVSTCSCKSLPNPNLNKPPTHDRAPPSATLFLLSAMLPNTYSVTHSSLTHWLPTH